MTRSLFATSRRTLVTRVALGLAVVAAASMAAGCASLGPSVRNADNASVDLADQQIHTSDLQIMNGLFIPPSQLGGGWQQQPFTGADGTVSGETGLAACQVGVINTRQVAARQYMYRDGSQWLVNQVLVYDNAADAINALSAIGASSSSASCLTTDDVGKDQTATIAAAYVINGASVEPNWFNPAAGVIAPASGNPGQKVQADGGAATAVIGQARGPFVSIVYGPADASSTNAPQDPSALTLNGATLAYQQLNQLTDADVGTGS